MPPIIPGAPWWANLVLLALAVTAPVVIAHMSTRRRLEDVKATQERQAKVIAEVHETTVNTHSSILRDESGPKPTNGGAVGAAVSPERAARAHPCGRS